MDVQLVFFGSAYFLFGVVLQHPPLIVEQIRRDVPVSFLQFDVVRNQRFTVEKTDQLNFAKLSVALEIHRSRNQSLLLDVQFVDALDDLLRFIVDSLAHLRIGIGQLFVYTL